MVEWVGIDGTRGADMGATYGDLIQAGIEESMLPCRGGRTVLQGPAYNPNKFYICPWTFFIEDGQQAWGPVPDVHVRAGDSVTVEIWQQSGTNWAISMVDNTSRQRWAVGHQYYDGPGASAEWIVEAPASSKPARSSRSMVRVGTTSWT
jgi:hypothetical protein